MLRGLFRTKHLDDILASIGGPQFSLKRTLGAFNVTLIGVGAIIGAGIFATVGSAAAGDPLAGRPGAGPSLMLSFVITACLNRLTMQNETRSTKSHFEISDLKFQISK